MGRKQILVVEDNELNREILCAILKESYQVLQAENGQAALALLRRQGEEISLILLDVVMPKMDGYTLLDILRGDPVLSSIPVIVTAVRRTRWWLFPTVPRTSYPSPTGRR